jgi:hypothetical protein
MDQMHSTQSAKSARTSGVDLSVQSSSNFAYSWMSVETGMPEAFRTVIAWSAASELPCVAYFDGDEKRWLSQHDGALIDNVTDWMHYLSPNVCGSNGRQPLPSAIDSAQVTDLAPDEQRLVGYFRAMDDRAREQQLRLASRVASDWPSDCAIPPAELEDVRNAKGPSIATSHSGARDGAPNMAAMSLDSALEGVADKSDDIDCSLSLASDLLRVALNECEKAGEAASYVDTVIRAARRYVGDISESNVALQRFVAVLEGKAK